MPSVSSCGRALTLAALTFSAAAVLAPATTPARAATVVDVMAWAPYWEATDALASFNQRPDAFTELTPFFWAASGVTTITTNPGLASSPTARDQLIQSYRQAAATAGKPIVATIVDGTGARVMAGILADPAMRSAHVNALVTWVTKPEYNFSGLDIDYEQFAFADPRDSWRATYDAWGAFITELADALHASGKTLAVAVPPIYNNAEDSTSGYWVYNYPVLAQKVDRIRIMTYSYSGNAGGPIAPYEWVKNSVVAAKNVPGMSASKIVMGIAAYGNDVITKIEGSCPANIKPADLKRKSVTTASAPLHAASKGVQPVWGGQRNNVVTAPGLSDPQEKVYEYVDSFAGNDLVGAPVRCNIYRKVWYSDHEAIYRRILLAQQLEVAGVAVWALGYDDATMWEGIAKARANEMWTPAGLPLPANVQAPAVLPPYPAPIYSAGPLPGRYLDTRAGQRTADGQMQGVGRRDAGSTLEVQIAGRGAVPTGTAAVTLNVTVIGDVAGFVTVYPCDTPRPNTSNLNVRPGQPVANSVVTRLSAKGTVCLYTQSPAHLLLDVFNVLPAASFAPLALPARLLDTRVGEPTIDGQLSGVGRMDVGSVYEVPIAGRGGVPGDATSAVLNVTSVGATNPGFLTLWPCDTPRPATSNVNFAPGAVVPNAVVTKLSASGTVCVFSSNPTHVVIDAFGQFAAARFAALTEPARLLDTRGGYSTYDGAYAEIGKQSRGAILELPIAGRAGLAADPDAVILNITVDQPAEAGYVTVYPCGTARPLVSNVNFAAGQTLPNLVVTQLSGSGSVCIYSHVPTHLIVDAFGSLTL